jgi:hypothetical protein
MGRRKGRRKEGWGGKKDVKGLNIPGREGGRSRKDGGISRNEQRVCWGWGGEGTTGRIMCPLTTNSNKIEPRFYSEVRGEPPSAD